MSQILATDPPQLSNQFLVKIVICEGLFQDHAKDGIGNIVQVSPGSCDGGSVDNSKEPRFQCIVDVVQREGLDGSVFVDGVY